MLHPLPILRSSTAKASTLIASLLLVAAGTGFLLKQVWPVVAPELLLVVGLFYAALAIKDWVLSAIWPQSVVSEASWMTASENPRSEERRVGKECW